MKLVLPSSFKLTAAFFCLLWLNCASTSKAPAQLENTISGPIINLRLANSIGPFIDENNSFTEPAGITFNALGEIYVSDRLSNSIYKFSPELRLLAREGGVGMSSGGFNKPLGIACDAALNLYVADNGNRQIQILDRDLHFVNTISSYYNDKGESINFDLPSDISIDREGNLWIADNDKILEINPFYNLTLEISNRVPGGVFIGKSSSAEVSSQNMVAVGDPDNGDVLLLSIYGNLTKRIAAGNAYAVAWDNYGEIWVADPESNRISAYDKNGRVLFIFSDTERGSSPAWIAFDSNGRLGVADKGLRKIRIYDIIRGTKQPDLPK